MTEPWQRNIIERIVVFHQKEGSRQGSETDGVQAYFEEQGKKETQKQRQGSTQHKVSKVFGHEAIVFEVDENPNIKQRCYDERPNPFAFIAHMNGVDQIESFH